MEGRSPDTSEGSGSEKTLAKVAKSTEAADDTMHSQPSIGDWHIIMSLSSDNLTRRVGKGAKEETVHTYACVYIQVLVCKNRRVYICV